MIVRDTRIAFPEFAAICQHEGGRMARVWPSYCGVTLTSCGPGWRAEDRREWRKCFEVVSHPFGCKTVRESGTVTDQSLDSSLSPPAKTPQTHQSADRHPFFFLPEGKKKNTRSVCVCVRGGGRGELFWGQHQGERKATFWQLEFWRKKNKTGPSSLWNGPAQWKGRVLMLKINVSVHTSLHNSPLIPSVNYL